MRTSVISKRPKRITSDISELHKKLETKLEKENAYAGLAQAFNSLGDFEEALKYFQLHLDIAKETGDVYGEENLTVTWGLCITL